MFFPPHFDGREELPPLTRSPAAEAKLAITRADAGAVYSSMRGKHNFFRSSAGESAAIHALEACINHTGRAPVWACAMLMMRRGIKRCVRHGYSIWDAGQWYSETRALRIAGISERRHKLSLALLAGIQHARALSPLGP